MLCLHASPPLTAKRLAAGGSFVEDHRDTKHQGATGHHTVVLWSPRSTKPQAEENSSNELNSPAHKRVCTLPRDPTTDAEIVAGTVVGSVLASLVGEVMLRAGTEIIFGSVMVSLTGVGVAKASAVAAGSRFGVGVRPRHSCPETPMQMQAKRR